MGQKSAAFELSSSTAPGWYGYQDYVEDEVTSGRHVDIDKLTGHSGCATKKIIEYKSTKQEN